MHCISYMGTRLIISLSCFICIRSLIMIMCLKIQKHCLVLFSNLTEYYNDFRCFSQKMNILQSATAGSPTRVTRSYWRRKRHVKIPTDISNRGSPTESGRVQCVLTELSVGTCKFAAVHLLLCTSLRNVFNTERYYVVWCGELLVI